MHDTALVGQRDDPILPALSLTHEDGPVPEIDILHPQPDTLQKPQSRAVLEAGDQPVWSRQVCNQPGDLVATECHRQPFPPLRPSPPDGITHPIEKWRSPGHGRSSLSGVCLYSIPAPRGLQPEMGGRVLRNQVEPACVGELAPGSQLVGWTEKLPTHGVLRYGESGCGYVDVFRV